MEKAASQQPPFTLILNFITQIEIPEIKRLRRYKGNKIIMNNEQFV
jgi:hypothetical protein